MAADSNRILNDGGSLTSRTSNFYVSKEIQRTYNFLVYFDESDVEKKIFNDLLAYHAISVELPNYEFKKEKMEYGPFVKNFPVLSHDGFEFTIKFEEDNKGSVKNLIHSLIRRNIDSDGYHKPYADTMIKDIVVSVYQADGTNVNKTFFKNCFYLKASTAQYSYDDGKQVFYDITFNADHYIMTEQRGALNQMEKNKYSA